MKKFWKYVIGIAIPVVIGTAAGLFTMSGMEAYAQLNSPPLSPPGILFPIVWSVLYVLMGIASVLVWDTGEGRAHALVFYALQLIVNFFWPIIFFCAREYTFAFVWLLVLLVLTVVTTVKFFKRSKAAGILMLPYLAWLLFAAYLNLGVAILN